MGETNTYGEREAEGRVFHYDFLKSFKLKRAAGPNPIHSEYSKLRLTCFLAEQMNEAAQQAALSYDMEACRQAGVKPT